MLTLDLGVVELLGTHACDQVTARRFRRLPQLTRQRHSANGSLRRSPSIVAGKKFIAGEPMKPATNRFTGLL